MLDAIAEAEGISVSKLRFRAMFGEGTFMLLYKQPAYTHISRL